MNHSDHGILLDRASNVRIFEKLATPHMLDERRVEEVKQYNQMSELPIGGRLQSRLSVHDDSEDEQRRSHRHSGRSQSSQSSRDSRESRGSRESRSSSRHSRGSSDNVRRSQDSHDSRRSRDSQRSDDSRPSDHRSQASRGRQSDQSSVHSRDSKDYTERKSEPSVASVASLRTALDPRLLMGMQAQSRMHSEASTTLPRTLPGPFMNGPPNGMRPFGAPFVGMRPQLTGEREPQETRSTVTIPPLPNQETEFERIRRINSEPDPTLETMRQQRQEQILRMQNGVRLDAPSSHPGAPVNTQPVPSSYITMFQNMCKTRPTQGSSDNLAFRDPDYAEKRELLIKLDEMRTLGFNVPKLDISMPLEDLQTEVQRRTISMGTVETVDMFISYISTGVGVLETLNNMAGPFLPMENYAQSVREGMQTPRFKYAMYQLVLRYQGRNGGSPWRVVLLVLLMPLIQGLLVKLIQWLAKGRFNLNSSMINSGIKTLFNKMGNSDPQKGVPSNIPGISPNIPKPTAAAADEPVLPSMPGFKPNPEFTRPAAAETPRNPFARFASQANQPKPASTAAPQTANVANAAGNNNTATTTGNNSMPTTTAAGPVDRKRPRLQRPTEILSDIQSTVSDLPSNVITPEQRFGSK